MNGYEQKTGFRHPIPPHTVSVVVIKRGGSLYTPVVEQNDKILVSDSFLMGALAAMQIDPISDHATVCGDRAWWAFSDPNGDVKKRCVAFFGETTREVGHLSFVRRCIELSKGFSEAAKEAVCSSRAYQPSNLRRL